MTATYRVTIDVDPEVAEDWLAWMRAVHVADVLREPGFERATIYRDTGASRFIVDYTCVDRAAVDAYLASDAVKRIRGEHEARYGGRARASRQILEPVATLAR